jgi:aryl-alcohol dehydrogenase-like predicted oxidoreductase
VRAGKILYVGVSDAPAWVVAQAQTTAKLRDWSPFAGLQVEYSLVERTVERELIPMACALGIGVTAWSPLAAGVLTGKYHAKANGDERRLDKVPFDKRSERNLSIGQAVLDAAGALGRSPAQVALNWLRARPRAVIPIIGARKLEQLRDNLGCVEWELDAATVERLDAASAIDPGFPSSMIAFAADFVYGGTFDQIDGARDRVPIPMPRAGAAPRIH